MAAPKAGLGAGPLGVRPARPQTQMSMAELQGRNSEALGEVMPPEVPEFDPRDLVKDLTQVPVGEDYIRGSDLMRSEGASVDTLDDVAQMTGSRYGANETEIPVLDDQGNVAIDPLTQQPIMRAVTPDDYNSTFQQEQQDTMDLQGSIRDLATNPTANAVDASRRMLEQRGEALQNGNVRYERPDEDYIARTSDESASVLANVVNASRAALLTDQSPVTMEVLEAGKPATQYSAGLKILADNNIFDPVEQSVVATVFGVAASKAAVQTPLNEKYSTKKRDEKSVVKDSQGNTIPDGMFLGDYINSIRHFAANGLKNAGVKVTPEGTEQLAKVAAFTAISKGDAIVVHDPQTNKRFVTMSGPAKEEARALQRISEVMLGDTSRGRSSQTPNPSGAGFKEGGQILTKKSLKDGEIVTAAAEATKDILGRIGTVFRPKDVDFANKALSFVNEGLYIDPETNKALYSESVFADRYGLGKANYEAAYNTVTLPDAMRSLPADDKRVQSFRKAKAAEVMLTKFRDAEFSMGNVVGSPGIRFTKYMHSLSNQRMFPDNFDTDYMGSKAVIRDMLGLAKQDIAFGGDLFDPARSNALKNKFVSLMRLNGKAKHDELMRLSPTEQGAIGAMFTTAVSYYSVIDPQPEILKTSEQEIISKYRPEMAEKLAELGKQYNDWLAAPTEDAEIVKHLAAMEKGESMGAKNLWDDLYQLKIAPKGRAVPMTHHNFDDGNQNGIFLQALFFGSTDNAIRLGTANPKLADMRGASLNKFKHQLEEQLTDNKEQLLAWKAFFKDAEDQLGRSKVAKDFFKAPLMQNAYGKDASMFKDYLYEVLDDSGDSYRNLLDKYVMPVYGNDLSAAVSAFGNAMEGTLQEVIDSKYAGMMKAIGRYTAILDQVVFMEGITGDTSVFSAPGVQPVNKNFDDSSYNQFKTEGGKGILLKTPNREVDILRVQGEDVAVESTTQGYKPSAAKASKMYLNRRTGTWDWFNNALGTAQSRMMAVMPIQAMDGDLLKWTTLFVNKGRKTPVPALWVHDSIISTPFGSLVYRNAYNNIAIPNAIPAIAKFGKMFGRLVDEAEKNTFRGIDANVNHLGVPRPVGIGDEGDFPALGAFFDELYDKTVNPAYESSFMDRPVRRNSAGKEVKSKKQEWNDYQTRVKKVLDEAKSYGWVTPEELPGRQRQYLAVSAADFKSLARLAKSQLKLAGPDEQFTTWKDNFANRVKATGSKLLTQAKYLGNTVFQMSQTGGNKPLKELPVSPTSKAVYHEKTEDDLTVPPLNEDDSNFDPNAPLPF